MEAVEHRPVLRYRADIKFPGLLGLLGSFKLCESRNLLISAGGGVRDFANFITPHE